MEVILYKKSIGFLGIMFIILFLLKVGVVETSVMLWSWWWIALPLWIFPAIVGLIAVVIFVVSVVAVAICWADQAKRRRRRKK